MYRQSALDCNPKEVNNAIENVYLVCAEAGAPKKTENAVEDDEDEEEDHDALPWTRIGASALLQLVSHLVISNSSIFSAQFISHCCCYEIILQLIYRYCFPIRLIYNLI